MINNRQNGRRRGRGGGPRSPNSAPSPGNARQDNRSRGNAAQLHEKYKAMARDSQLAGDRVQTEYYLQFADHYFRVLNENRSRFEEQRPRHRDDEYGDEDEGDEDMVADGEDAPQEEERVERPRREYRERADRNDNRDRQEPREVRGDEGRRSEGEGRNGEARFAARPRRSRREVNGEAEGAEAEESRIALDILPPAISASPAPADGADGEDEQPRPRRRTRRPRADDAGEPAPAAA